MQQLPLPQSPTHRSISVGVQQVLGGAWHAAFFSLGSNRPRFPFCGTRLQVASPSTPTCFTANHLSPGYLLPLPYGRSAVSPPADSPCSEGMELGFCRTAIAKAPWSSVQDLIKPGPFTQTTALVLGVFFLLRGRLRLVIPAANRRKVHHLNPPFRSLGTAVIPGYCPRYFPQVQIGHVV